MRRSRYWEEIKHFDHGHLLGLGTLDESHRTRATEGRFRCRACLKLCECRFQHYICEEGCGYLLHESCGKLPKEVRSPFHTPHRLTRQLIFTKKDELLSCCACGEGLSSSWALFRCQLDQECALMMPVKEKDEVPGSKGEVLQIISFYLDLWEGSELHTHPNHQHPLLLFNEMPKGKNFNCPMCGENCGNRPTYCCCECQLYLHRSCFERKLPQKIPHFYHPHPLTLSPTPTQQLDQNIHPRPLTLSASMLTVKIQCEACYRESSRVWCYSCKQCSFVMDIDCSTLLHDIKSESEEQIQHFLHGHPLSLSLSLSPHNDKYPNKCCLLCGKGCASDTTYVCRVSSSYCDNIYFHKSCLVFPQHIFHPLHPYHLLTLANLKFKQLIDILT